MSDTAMSAFLSIIYKFITKMTKLLLLYFNIDRYEQTGYAYEQVDVKFKEFWF